MNRKMRSRICSVLTLILLTSIMLPVFAVPASASAEAITVSMDQNDIVQSDFLGIGVNTIPTALMPGSTQYGYTEAHWEMDRKRIMTVKPKVARVWFQIDWMEKEKGVYDFDSMEMEALYHYLDAFKAAGTEIELNFGWKVGEDVHDWFNIPGVDPWTSAPADLDAYAVSASKLLQELIFARGYVNVKYLTFYNEPNGNWDFEAPGDQQAYYAEMVRKTSEQLAADGIRDIIEIWGPEETGAPLWTKYMKDNADAHIDGYTFHVYGESYDGLGSQFALRQSYVGDKPIHLTEFGWASDDASNWHAGYANSVIQSANMGVKSALMWQLNGVWSYDPYGDTSGTYTMWDNLLYGLQARKTFYSVGMLMRYVPEHSEVLKVTTSDPDNARAAAFRGQDGEYTIVLETREGSDKEVTFDFLGGSIDKTFRKFVYQDDIARDGHALLPASSGTYAAGASFTDNAINSEYNVIVYTTAAPQTQVQVTPLESTMTSDQTLQLAANVIDNTGGVTWSVLGEGNGSIDAATGLFTPPAVETEKVIAVKAVSTADPDGYGIAFVKVRPASSNERVDTPEIGLEPGVYGQSEAVYITTATENAKIYYTTNGETPTEASRLYTGAVVLEEGKTVLLQARAFKDGLLPSGTTSALYKVHQNSKGPDGYTFCMYDNGDLCQLEQPASVAYGADGLFNYVNAADDIACTSASFGGDPIPGVEKRCYYSYEIPDELPLVTIYNAGFEKPNTSGTVVGPTVNGWTFNSRTGIQANGSVFAPTPAPEGDQSAYLKTDGGVPGEISQSIYFKPGTYQVEFQAAKRTSFGGTQTFDVYIDDMVIGSYSAEKGEYQKFLTESFTVDATKKLTLRFAATTTEGDNTAFIDAVRVVQPVEPPAPYLTNAGFEQPSAASDEDHVLGGIESGWSFDANAGIVRNGNALLSPNAPFGVQAGYLKSGGGEAGSFSQNVSFPAGTYAISFQAAAIEPGVQTIDIFAGDQLIDSVAPSMASFKAYETVFFTVAEGEYDIRFAARATDGAAVSFIDSVAIHKIEIPVSPAIANSSFETPPVTSGTGVLVGGTSGWGFNNYAGIIRNGSVFDTADAPDGTQAGYLQSKDGSKGEFSQAIVFPAGHFAIQFQAAKRTSFGGQQTFAVYLDDTVIGTFTPASGSYTAFSTQDFVIDQPSKHMIRFAATTETGDNTAFIDAISVVPFTPPALAAVNAGFESPAITSSSGTVWNLEAGWKFNGHAGMAKNGSVFDQAAAPEGTQVAYLLTDGAGHGEISQTIEFPAGTYKMSFYSARRSYGGQQSFDVMVGDQIVGSVTPTDIAFSQFTTNPFTVAAGSYEVKFVATTTSGDNTAFIDAVSLEEYIPPTAPVAENLSFETPEVTTSYGTIWNIEAGWTFNANAGIARNGSVLGQPNATDGDQVAYLLTSNSYYGEIRQSVLFPAGTYKMTFDTARRSYGGQQSFDVMVDGQVIASVTPTNKDAFVQVETVTFTVTEGMYEVAFVATTTAGDNTAFVDNIAFHKVIPLSSEKHIVSFAIEDLFKCPVVIDQEARTVEVTMPPGYKLHALSPVIGLPEGASISPGSGLTQDFSNGPIVYTVMAEDGTTAEWTVTVKNAVPPGQGKKAGDDMQPGQPFSSSCSGSS